MPRRLVTFVLIAVVAAAACIRLGFWQLSRLRERRAVNAVVRARVDRPVVDVSELRPDSSSRFRRARVSGTPDYDHELVLTIRSYQGSPGLYLLTPMRIPGRDTAVLVNRGWVYAPDGMTVDLARWREPDSVYVGYVDLLNEPRAGASPAALSGRPHLLRRLDRDAVARVVPYPVSPLVIVALPSRGATASANQVARLDLPPLDEGPHLGYAFQWFAFATIALAGSGVVVAKHRASGSDPRVIPIRRS